MSVQILINGTDVTKRVSSETIQIQNILTRKRDTCELEIVNRDSDPYTPTIGNEIIVYLDATKVFGGVITALEQKSEAYKLIKWKVSCVDYTRILDRRLVPDTYSNMTVDAIIADLQSLYMPSGFTINNVDCPIVIKYIAFNYVTVSKCLEQLADITGYDFYIDYDKDIHFFDANNGNAPVDVQDDNGTFVYDSLVIRSDNSQVRNSIVVRGGQYLGTTFTTEILANGTDAIYPLGYKYSGFRATLTGEVLHIGIDNVDNPDLYDAMYNFQEKIIRFRESRKPTINSSLRISGKPYLPVIVKVKDPVSISTVSAEEGGDGIYESLILDPSINSKEGARQRAVAELQTYATTLSQGEFMTLTEGFRAGQNVLINSTSRGVNERYIVNRVTLSQFDSDSFIYRVSLVTTKTFDLIDLLMRMSLSDTKAIIINPDEVVDLVDSSFETITFTDSIDTSVTHNPQTETITIGESFTPQSLNYAVQFVTGPYAPTGTKRVFILNGSRLG